MLLFFLALTVAAAQATGDPSMYRIELLPTPDMRGAGGVVELGWVQSPFGVAVTREGHHVYEISMRIEGLPEPSTLGSYSTGHHAPPESHGEDDSRNGRTSSARSPIYLGSTTSTRCLTRDLGSS